MNRLAEYWMKTIRRAGVFSIILYSPASCLLAGEPIIFSNEKSQPQDPNRLNKTGSEFLKTWEHARSSDPFDAVMPPTMPRISPSDPKLQKRRQNAQDEQRNWLLLRPGELTEKDEKENTFGVRDKDFSLDDVEKGETSRDYTFYPLTTSKNSANNRAPGRGQERKTDQPVQPKSNSESDQDERRNTSDAQPKRDSQLGAHTASELDLRNLMDASQTGPRTGDKSELSLRDVFGSAAADNPARERQSRRDEFDRFLNQSPSSAPVSGPADPINFRGVDLTRQPLNPVSPGTFDSPLRSAPNGDSFGSVQNLRPPNSSGFASGLPELNTPRSFAPTVAPSPFLQPQDPSRQWIQPPSRDMHRSGLLSH